MRAPYLDDRELSSAVHTWLHADDGPPPDRVRQVDAIVATAGAEGQRHRWWPLIPLIRGGHATAGVPRRLVRPAPVGAAASVVLLVVVVAFAILLSSRPLPPAIPGGSSIDPSDRPVINQLVQLWAGALPASAAADVYSEDAIHTVVWTDEIERFVGTDEISARINVSYQVLPELHAFQRLPDGDAGEHRYLDVAMPSTGVPCLIQVADGRVERHDCIFPIPNGGPGMVPGSPPDDVSRAELEALIGRAWSGDEEAFDQVVSSDIEHRVAFDDSEAVSAIDAYRVTAFRPGSVEKLAPAVPLPAPSGELRWTSFVDVAGGSLCTMWARDGRIVRHDCVVPFKQ